MEEPDLWPRLLHAIAAVCLAQHDVDVLAWKRRAIVAMACDENVRTIVDVEVGHDGGAGVNARRATCQL